MELTHDLTTKELEIVHKALEIESATLTINGSGNCFIDGQDEQIAQFSDCESLLAWAKQTVGE